MEEKTFKEFEKKIYTYCDNNIGNKVLFSGFEWLYTEPEKVIPRDLVNLTGIIVRDLVEKNILKEVPKEKAEHESVYGLYEILPHEKLIKENIRKR
jgi:hypothetical protein